MVNVKTLADRIVETLRPADPDSWPPNKQWVELLLQKEADDVAELEAELKSVKRGRAEVLRWRAEEIDKLEQERDHLRELLRKHGIVENVPSL